MSEAASWLTAVFVGGFPHATLTWHALEPGLALALPPPRRAHVFPSVHCCAAPVSARQRPPRNAPRASPALPRGLQGYFSGSFQPGQPLTSGAVGLVRASKASGLKEGAVVTGMLPWTTHVILDAQQQVRHARACMPCGIDVAQPVHAGLCQAAAQQSAAAQAPAAVPAACSACWCHRGASQLHVPCFRPFTWRCIALCIGRPPPMWPQAGHGRGLTRVPCVLPPWCPAPCCVCRRACSLLTPRCWARCLSATSWVRWECPA